jgi:glutamyl-tRNA reductase
MSSLPLAHVGSAAGTTPAHDSGEPSGARVAPLVLFGFEFSLETASLDALEAVARSVTRPRVAAWFSRSLGTEEVARLTTCHRVELLLLVRCPEEVDRWRDLLPGDPAGWKLRAGREVVHHLFRVAAGRESLAVGEAEARHQVRAAAAAVESRHPRPVLRDLLLGGAAAADEVSPVVPSSRSIASIAAARLLGLVVRPAPRVLVVGSGTVGRQVAESLRPSAEVTLMFHQRPPEEAFLRSTGARAVPLDRLAEEIAVSDAVVTAAKFGTRGLRAADVPPDRPLVLVDLGVPRNIDPDVAGLSNVRLVDLEELHAFAGGLRVADGVDARVEVLAARFADGWERALLEPWVDELRRRAEEVRRGELAHARAFFGALDPEQEVALERLTQRLVARLLHSPTERLRSLPLGPEGDLQRRLAVELFRPAPAEP